MQKADRFQPVGFFFAFFRVDRSSLQTELTPSPRPKDKASLVIDSAMAQRVLFILVSSLQMGDWRC